MEIIENTRIKEKLYIEKLANGMTVIILPKKDVNKKCAILAVKYGSNDNEFISIDEKKKIKIPNGVAHFLEHKMFEQKNGTNSLDTLTAMGVSANAYTTNNHTAYLFECIDNFYEALSELINYVQNPYFTDENVEKEKEIIAQEIMMYNDYPDWVVYMEMLKNLYKNEPINIDPAGDLNTIKKINKEILYKCYNTFYNLSNMTICISGDFKPKEIIEEVSKRIDNNKNNLNNNIKRIYKKEPIKIVKEKTIKKMNINIPIFIIGIKDNKKNTKDIIKRNIAIEIILNMLLGKSSKLYKNLYENGFIKCSLGLQNELNERYSYITISGQAKEPEKILDKVLDTFEYYKKNGLDKNSFIRIKNMIYSEQIINFNNILDSANLIINDYLNGINSFEYFNNYDKITLNYLNKILKGVFKKEQTTISIIESKNKKRTI